MKKMSDPVLTQAAGQDGELFNVRVHIGSETQPTVSFHRADGKGPILEYHVSTFVGVGPCRRFVSPSEHPFDDDHMQLSPAEHERVRALVLRSIPPTSGRFEVVWVKNDPSVPF